MSAEKPIIMCGAMVRALLSGTKQQTRRIIKPQPFSGFSRGASYQGTNALGEHLFYPAGASDSLSDIAYYTDDGLRTCPYHVGMTLWVRETFAELPNGEVIFRADQPSGCGVDWKPSIFLTRKLSRITLEVESVRVQRVNEISEEDAKAEGAIPYDDGSFPPVRSDGVGAQAWFQTLWNGINGKKHGCAFEDGCFVWAVGFHVLTPTSLGDSAEAAHVQAGSKAAD